VEAVAAVEAVDARPTVGAAGCVEAVTPIVAVVAVVAVDAVGAVGAVAAVGDVGMPSSPAAWLQAPDRVRAVRSAIVARLTLTGFAEPFTGGLSMSKPSRARAPKPRMLGPVRDVNVSGLRRDGDHRRTIRMPAPWRR